MCGDDYALMLLLVISKMLFTLKCLSQMREVEGTWIVLYFKICGPHISFSF